MGTLRTLLALSVVLAHAPGPAVYSLAGGRNAVQLFYMISGFVITHVLLSVPAYQEPRTFYASRVLRLFPAYFAACAFALAWYAVAEPGAFAFLAQLPASALAFLALVNATILGQEWTLFLEADQGTLRFTPDFYRATTPLWRGLVLPQSWTLSLELMFYALAPWLVRRQRWLWAVLAVSLGARAWAASRGWGLRDPWTYRFFPFEIALFAAGSLSYRVMLAPWRRIVAARRSVAGAGTALVAAAVLAYPFIAANEAVATLGLMALVWATLPLTFLFQEGAPVDRHLGELSYPLYIGHYVMASVATALAAAAGIQSRPAVLALYVVAAFAMAVFLLRAIGRPVERLRTRLRRMPPPVQLSTSETGTRGATAQSNS